MKFQSPLPHFFFPKVKTIVSFTWLLPYLFLCMCIHMYVSTEIMALLDFEETYLCVYFCLGLVFVAVYALSPDVASGNHCPVMVCGLLTAVAPSLLLFSFCRTRPLGRVAEAPRLTCRAARRILVPDQGSILCPLRWQVDTQPLGHHESPRPFFF